MRRILVHQPREQLGVETSPIDADAHRLRVNARLLDHRRELRIALAALADVAGIDAELRERASAVGHLGEQLVAVEMEVADQRNTAPERVDFSRIDGTAAAASTVFTVTRTSSEPAAANAFT